MKATKQIIATGIVAGIIGLAVGWGLSSSDTPSTHAPAAVAEQDETWTCSMHPQIRQPGPGQCPICGMDLIPVAAPAAGDFLGPRQLRLSPAAQELASIQTAPVERRFAPVETRMVGKIAVDETQVRSITAWVAGRIDRLYVDYTGVRVEKGDHIAYLYSPELLTAQEELIQALRARARLVDSGTSVGQTAQATVEAAREKLRLLGLKEEQIERVERERRASDHLTIYAPTGGVVIKKHLSEGAYVQTGTPIYTIADLSRLWLELQAYESDMSWIHYGQAVEFSAEAYPGEVFSGQISFVDPVLDERTRTVRVRVNVANEQGRLKPGMLVWAVAQAEVGAHGRAMSPALTGKWISPMHPEIVRDAPGACDICGMALVRAEELYDTGDEVEREMPLVVPASAPLLTGKRAVVYVALGEGLYEGREVVLGPRAGDYYLVREGLREGEQVVVNGAFKIDSALQIRAQPSMMNAPARADQRDDEPNGHAHGPPSAVWTAYFATQQALSKDDLSGAQAAAATLAAHPASQEIGDAISGAGDLAAARQAFAELSTVLIRVARQGGVHAGPVHLFHCPMAFDNEGAAWLQQAMQTQNPYFGGQMYRCGSLRETFAGHE